MKYIKCNECLKEWYVKNTEIDGVTTCPFCSRRIREKKTISEMDTLGKVIYKALLDRGMDMLVSPRRLVGYLSDMAPDLKREVKIFSKTFDENYLKQYRDAFQMDLKDAEIVIKQLRYQFISEEGLSETWADMLCENCLEAIRYSKGEGLPEIIFAEIIDVGELIASIESYYHHISQIEEVITKLELEAHQRKDYIKKLENEIERLESERRRLKEDYIRKLESDTKKEDYSIFSSLIKRYHI